jgi:penicillin amidase
VNSVADQTLCYNYWKHIYLDAPDVSTSQQAGIMSTTIIIALLFILFALVAVLGGGYFFVYWWMIQRPVPKLDGTVALPGLAESVHVLRDKFAIPHIYAASRADLFRAQGYIHAQERLWQMEQQRRTARGTLAELFGEAALDADRFSRIVGFQRAAEAELPTLDPDTRQTLDWYAEGVNQFIQANPGKLAAEFNLLRSEPDPWQAIDSIGVWKVLAWGLSGNWESELIRLRLLDQLGPIRAADLEPNYPEQTPIILEGVGSDEATRMLYAAGLLLNQYENVKQWFGVIGEGQGSNSWALAPERSQNGKAMLCNDPHLALQIPGTWYENQLTAPDFEVSGVSVPGIPGIVIGHNQSIAWGMTNAMVDVQDLFIEHAHPDDPTRFEFMEELEEATIHEEIIQVRRQPQPHIERVVVTRHGPLISGLLTGLKPDETARTLPLSLQWTGHQPDTTLRALLDLNQARNREEFETALAGWTTPPQNVTYADSEGHIGYVLAGRVPLREQNLGLLPAPGWNGEHEWHSYIPATELPRLFDPPSGAIVTANNKMVGDDYPYFLGIEFAPGWRAKRIEGMIGRKPKHAGHDMEEMQLDTGSTFAEALAPLIGLLHSEDAFEKVALNAIRSWNLRMDTDSEAALVFHYILLYLLEMTFGDKIGPVRSGFLGISDSPFAPANGFMSRAELRLLQILSENETSTWYMEAKTGRTRNRDQLLQEALTLAVKRVRKTVGDSALKWDWGRSHQIRYVHQLGSARFLRGFFNRGPFPIGGDGTTPLQTRHAPNLPLGLVQITPSYRQIYEVGDWDRAETITTSGQSGHPLSDHYDNQIAMFREGVYHPMPWTREAVEEGTIYRMVLRPGSQQG